MRGIVRISGPDAWEIGLAGFEVEGSGSISPERPTLIVGQLTIDGLRNRRPASVGLWPGPRTYTGQPLVEIHTTGCIPVLQSLLADRLSRGARLAEPGEFTLRAFLSGRIDLTQAEAVLGVIDAAGPAQLDAALRQLAGGLASPIAGLRDRLLDTLAHLEAGLDFVDEADVDPVGRAILARSLDGAADEVAGLADRMSGRDRPEGLPRVVLVGPPNAGKSRLFNALVGEERVIVSPIAGTTRDYLGAKVEIDGMLVELVDTAGREAPEGEIEARAQVLREEVAASGHLLIDCGAFDTGFLPDPGGEQPRLRVWNKADLGPAPGPGMRSTSAATGEGLDELRSAVRAALLHRTNEAEGQIVAATGARCREGLVGAGRALRSAAETLMLGGGDELVAIDVRTAVDELGRVVGAVFNDDVLDRVFGRFCIGK